MGGHPAPYTFNSPGEKLTGTVSNAMGESDLRCIHSRHVRRLSVSLLQITDERFARPGCAAIGSHVYPFAVGWRLCVPVGIRVTGIYAGTCHIVRNPVLGLPAPSARLGFQMIVAIDRISEHGIGVNISFVRPATLNIAAGDPAEPFHLSNLQGQISPDNGVIVGMPPETPAFTLPAIVQFVITGRLYVIDRPDLPAHIWLPAPALCPRASAESCC